jgi:class 3 adenylate cyclase/tetratricopeptide (TPR) repeat protein
MARTETVTVAFTDLVGSTELASRVGHDAYELLRHSHFDGLRVAVTNHNGSEIKTTGDGLMLRFSSAADAVACAIAMQQSAAIPSRHEGAAPLEIRIGVSSGEATQEGNDLFGPPVVEASRLCAAASARQILVSDVVRTLTRGKGHRFTSVGDLTLKGLPEPVPAFEVVWEPLSKPSSGIRAIFARTGEYWTVRYGDANFSLKDVKGLSYIQRLLQHPGEEFHALDLLDRPGAGSSAAADETSMLSDTGVGIGGLGDAGEMLDGRAKQEYKRRLLELREKLTELRERGDSDRAAEVESEIDFLAREIARAVGLGGRDRRAGSAAERARLNVTRAIKGALQKIAEHSADLEKLLDRTIKTGAFCSYLADPRLSISWQLSLDGPNASVDVESTAPLLLKGNTSFLRGLVDRTTFVGRTREYAALRGFLDQAVAGESRVVMLGGPPGVGKTRLATEIGAEASEKGYLTIAGNCYDRDDAVPFIPIVEILDDALARSTTPEAFRGVLGDDAAEVARLMPQLRRMFPDIPPPSEATPEQSRRALFSAIAKFLARLAENSPVLLILEDLHWADEGTLSLLTHLARSFRKLPVMIIGTFRDYELDSSGPLAQTLDDCTRLHLLERLDLHGLSPTAVSEMIRTLSGQQPPSSLVDAIHSRTEGNPFFVEELYKHLNERGRLFDSSGKFRSGFKPGDLDVPQSVRLVIQRRLARLDDETRKMLDTAAVIGRSFTFALLEASTKTDADPLLDSLEESEAAGLVSSSLEHLEALFQFSHELIRQVVLDDLSAARRQRFHLKVADAIEGLNDGSLEDKINDLAYHLWHAGAAADRARTIECLMRAANRAQEQSAYETALSHLSNALERLRELAPSAARDEQELAVYLKYLRAVRLTDRWTTTEAGVIYTRARELCERSGQSPKMLEILQGSANFHLGRGELMLAQDYAQRILEISRSSSQNDSASSGHFILGHALCCLGDLVSAHSHLEAVRFRDSTVAPIAGGRAKIFSQGIEAMVLWMLGYPDLARASAERGAREAEESKNRFAISFSRIQLHIVVMFRGEFSKALEIGEHALRDATAKHFEWLRTAIGWSMEACRILGHASEGSIDRAQQAFDAQYASEAKLYKPHNCTVLAECCGKVGQVEAGISRIEQAFSAMQETNEKMSEPETWRVKASLLLQLAGSPGIAGDRAKELREEGETCLRTAISKAQLQASKSWELRASVDLGRLLKSSRRDAEAGSIVRAAYDWFTEGFDTPDLVQARALLAELAT